MQALLSAPNPDDPLANDVAELWKVSLAVTIFIIYILIIIQTSVSAERGRGIKKCQRMDKEVCHGEPAPGTVNSTKFLLLA